MHHFWSLGGTRSLPRFSANAATRLKQETRSSRVKNMERSRDVVMHLLSLAYIKSQPLQCEYYSLRLSSTSAISPEWQTTVPTLSAIIVTVGLGVSDFGYRIFVLLISVISYMDSVQGFGAQVWPWQWQGKEKQETLYYKECINTAICTLIALQSNNLFQSLLEQHCFFGPPTPACLPVYILLFQV